MISDDDVINSIINVPFCLFFGAGISRGVGLPLGNELGTMILEALGAPSHEAQDIASKYHLERMLFFLKAILGQSVHDAYGALSYASYGQNHFVLSALNNQKKIPLLTTNQDELIEIAGQSHHNNTNYLKIHGTISDKDSLCVTLDRVSSLSPKMLSELVDITNNRKIIVIGYSFSDFDLKDFFQSCRDRIYYCAFNGERNDFLAETVWAGDKNKYDEHCFNSSAEIFLEKLSIAMHVNISSFAQNSHVCDVKKSINEYLKKWASGYPKYLCAIAVGRLPQGLWQGRKSSEIIEKICDDEAIPSFYRAIAITEAANASHGQANYKKENLLLDRLGKICNLDYHVTQLLESLYRAASHHIQDNPFDWIMGLKLYRSAKKYLTTSLQQISDDNQKTIIRSYEKHINLGIASSLEKIYRFLPLSKFLDESISLITEYIDNIITIDIDFLCEALFVRAKIYIHNNEIDKSEEDYSRALSVARWIKKCHSIDQALRGLGRIKGIKKEYDTAIELLLESHMVAEETNEPILVARNHLIQAWVYSLIKNNSEYLAHKNSGVLIYKQYRGVVKGTIDSYLYMNRGR